MKSKLFVVVVLLLSVAMLTTGAFAYFSSMRTITGSHITAGTLDLKLNNDCRTGGTTWGDTALAWNFDGIAPGGFVEQTICMKNIGSVDAGQVRYDWSDLLNDPEGVNLAKQMIIVDAQDNADGGVNQTTAFNSFGIFTLYDLAEFRPGVGGWDAWSSSNVFPYLPANGEAWLYLKFKFNPDAGNEFQGDTVYYNLSIEAVQQAIY